MDVKSLARSLLPALILALYVLALWYVLLPPWKRELMLRRLMETAKQGQHRAGERLLTVRDEIEITRFRNLISRYDHEQVAARDKPKGSN